MNLRKRLQSVCPKDSESALVPRPEVQLLLCAARLHLDPETSGQMEELLRQDIDWSFLITAAKRHGLTPLLCWHLTTTFSDLVQQPVIDKLRKRFVENSAHNLWLAAELVQILDLFERHDIAAVPLKGPVLAATVYKNLALREFDDLDILVPEPKIGTAESLLRFRGYQPTVEVPHAHLRAFHEIQYAVPCHNENKLVSIDLQWKIAPVFFPFVCDMAGVWARSGWTTLAGNRVRNLSSEDALLILCAHGGKHFWGRIEWICGVAELIQGTPNLNWDWILGQARAYRSERILFFGLLMALDVLGVALPDQVLDRLGEHADLPDLAAEARRRLVEPEPPPITAMRHSVHQFRLADRRRDAFRFLFKSLFTPRYHDWIEWKLPEHFSFLYYPFRILRIITKYAFAPLSRRRNTSPAPALERILGSDRRI